MSRYDRIYLVDTENVGYQDCTNLVKDESIRYKVYCFTNMSFHNKTKDKHIKIVRCDTKKKKNALDFCLVTYLGFILRQFGKNTSYYIISDDKGYNSVVNYWQNLEYKVYRIGMPKQVVVSKSTINRCRDIYKYMNKNHSDSYMINKMKKAFKNVKGVNKSNIDIICRQLLAS